MALNREELIKLIEEGLITDYINLDVQITPNGFDLTVRRIFEFDTPGALDFSNKERKLPAGKKLTPQKEDAESKFGWWNLKKGAYKVVTNETVNLPRDLIGIAFSRTSLLRMGAFTQNGVWDAGFRGKSEFILVVENQHGIKIKENARIVQLTFERINKTEKGYDGIYLA
ncbi:MAG: deoxyuridine 5'-triphosphate nucleotidohydrolase [Candidatus Omnitrophica bacterium]|nr:deoxyuridine 5'-triphosphate nucleotidohydrolase [Candidatus Omnitrophota bacterium]